MFNLVAGVRSFKMPKLTLATTSFMVGLFYLFGPACDLLIYFGLNVVEGQIWRLVSANLIHCDINHLTWNMIAFIILGSVLENRSPYLLLNSFIAGIIGISLWLLLDNSITIYCGLSGVLNSLFVIVIYSLWQDTKNPILFFITLGYIAKLTLEIITTSSLMTDISWTPIPQSHLIGMLSGLAYIIIMRAINVWLRQA